ncbi:MAG: 50S ribosomal protein L10 [Candidatus Micrarchaeota archaeon]|nr:50S ribosomal protein L10 [Candidatus Micrarchaeota archaeon]
MNMSLTKDAKKKAVTALQKEIEKFPVVAVASISGLPSKQYNAIRKRTREKAQISFARLSLMKRALSGSTRAQELDAINQALGDGSVLVFSDMDAFKLFKLFKQNKSKMPAKAGAIAPSDLVIPAGETNLAPGPVLTELKQAGIQAKIQGPKVVIMKDATVAKKGEPVSAAAAMVLGKLGIEPMEVGLQVQKVFDHGTLYEGSVLNIDEQAVLDSLVLAHQQSLNLAVEAQIYNDLSTPLIIEKAQRAANAIQKLVEEKSGAPAAEKPAEKDEAPAAQAPEQPEAGGEKKE